MPAARNPNMAPPAHGSTACCRGKRRDCAGAARSRWARAASWPRRNETDPLPTAPMTKIPFNRPYMTGQEPAYIAQAHALGHLSGDGRFTRECHAWLEGRTGAAKALLTHSCTAALE